MKATPEGVDISPLGGCYATGNGAILSQSLPLGSATTTASRRPSRQLGRALLASDRLRRMSFQRCKKGGEHEGDAQGNASRANRAYCGWLRHWPKLTSSVTGWGDLIPPHGPSRTTGNCRSVRVDVTCEGRLMARDGPTRAESAGGAPGTAADHLTRAGCLAGPRCSLRR